MDILYDEILNFWKVLEKHNVRYIMTGGFATRFHGYNRLTDELDFWVENTPANRAKLLEALVEIEFKEDAFSSGIMGFLAVCIPFRLKCGVVLKVMSKILGLEGITFKECLEMASIAEIQSVKVPFLHIDHLILSKKGMERSKDKVDVIYLKKIRKLRKGNKLAK